MEAVSKKARQDDDLGTEHLQVNKIIPAKDEMIAFDATMPAITTILLRYWNG